MLAQYVPKMQVDLILIISWCYCDTPIAARYPGGVIGKYTSRAERMTERGTWSKRAAIEYAGSIRRNALRGAVIVRPGEGCAHFDRDVLGSELAIVDADAGEIRRRGAGRFDSARAGRATGFLSQQATQSEVHGTGREQQGQRDENGY